MKISIGIFLLLVSLTVAGLGQSTSTRARTTPTPSPTPVARSTASPTPSPAPVQTIEQLQATLRQRLFSPEARRGRIGAFVVSLSTGRVIFESDAEKYFMPASNMKNFTVAAALEKLGPDFRFVTSIFASALPDTDGTINGDLRIFGRGDVSISTAFYDGDHYKGLDALADTMIASGVKRIKGSIVGDESHFKGFAIPEGWEWEDLQRSYGAEISALPLNDNAVDVAVTPGSVGSPCMVTVTPANPLIQIQNLCTTTASGSRRSVSIGRRLERNLIEITGSMPAGEPRLTNYISVWRPAELFVHLLRQRLELKGVVVEGTSRLQPEGIQPTNPQVEIAKHESPPLAIIAAKTMKPSQNMYTETLLWTLGEHARARTAYPTVNGTTGANATSSALGIGEVKQFLKEIGIPGDAVLQYDGSGLSRHNLITPSAVAGLYTYMATKSKHSQAWRDSLTVGGVDGTLRNRFKGTRAENNMRGKTGTINQVSALSGYVTTAGGEELVVSFLVNGVTTTSQRVALIDDMIVALANFNGKIE